MDWYRITTSILTGLGLVACIAFCTHYFIRTRGYRRSEYWYMLMAWPTSLGALLLYIFVARFIGQSLFRQVVGLVLYSSLLVMVPWLHRLMLKSMSKGHVPSTKTPDEGGKSQ